MSVPRALLIFAIAWIAAIVLGRLVIWPLLGRGPGRDPVFGLVWLILQVYSRAWHRVRFTGAGVLPRSDDDHDGLIVVANHTGAVDPLLVQTRCGFFIRWMMAADMMGAELDWLWHRQPIIPVARDGKDTGPLREAIRQVKAGAAVGIFPEGRITMPPGELRPFLPGVGLVVTRTRAPVLLVWISGTPETNKLGPSLKTRSHARVAFVEMIRFDDERDPAVVTERLRARLAEVSGWPLNDEVIPPGGSRADDGRPA